MRLTRLTEYKQEVNVSSVLGPLHMSPVDRAGSLPGTNFPLGSYEKFQPGFSRLAQGQRSRGRFWHEIRETKPIWQHKNYNFRAYHSFGNS